jgi:hypothetical protein
LWMLLLLLLLMMMMMICPDESLGDVCLAEV